jgi:hypothetical protein
MFVKIRTLGGVTFNVLVQGKATVLDLKKKLPTPASYLKNISLVYKGNELPDFMSIQQLEYTDSDFLVVVFNKKRHREAKDKETEKNGLTKNTFRKQPRLSLPTTIIREEEALRNLRRRRNVRVHVGSTTLPTLSTSPPSISDLPWGRSFDAISSGSESSDQETPLSSTTRPQRQRNRTLGNNSHSHSHHHHHHDDDLIDFEDVGDGGSSSGSGSSSTWSQLRGLNQRLREPSSPSYMPSSLETQSLSETLSRSTREMKSATEAILERMHQRRASLSGNNLSEGKFKVDEDKLNQLGTMGFRKPAATRALLLHRNNLEASVVWLLENSSSPRINDPISTEEMNILSRPNPFLSLHHSHSTSPSTSSTPSSTTNNATASNTPTPLQRRNSMPRTRATRASFSDYMGLNQLDQTKFFDILPTTPTSALGSTLPLSLPRLGMDPRSSGVDL